MSILKIIYVIKSDYYSLSRIVITKEDLTSAVFLTYSIYYFVSAELIIGAIGILWAGYNV